MNVESSATISDDYRYKLVNHATLNKAGLY